MIDTIHTVVKTIEKTADNGIDLINKVDSFYNSAWDKLIIMCSVALAIIGIAMPLILQWYQKKNIKISEAKLKSDIEAQASKLKAEILAEINITLEKRIKSFDIKFEEIHASTLARAFHLQADARINVKYISGAYCDYIYAAVNYIKCDDYINLQTVLEMILKLCLPELSIEEIENLNLEGNADLDALLKELSDKNEKGIYSNIIRDIKAKKSKLPKTILEK